MTYPICSCCGQDIVVPEGIRKIHGLWQNERFILMKLARAEGKVVRHDDLRGGKKGHSLNVQISHLREALRDEGLPWEIVHVKGLGYKLERKPDVQRVREETNPSGREGREDRRARAS